MLINKIFKKMANKKILISNITQNILKLVKKIILKILSCTQNNNKIIKNMNKIWTLVIIIS